MCNISKLIVFCVRMRGCVLNIKNMGKFGFRLDSG